MIHHQFILFSHSYFINIQYSVMNIPSQKVSTLVKKFQKNPHSPVPILKKITKQVNAILYQDGIFEEWGGERGVATLIPNHAGFKLSTCLFIQCEPARLGTQQLRYVPPTLPLLQHHVL